MSRNADSQKPTRKPSAIVTGPSIIEEDLGEEKLKEENNRLQSKVEKNEKTLQMLQSELGEFDAVAKAKESVKKRNSELQAEHDAILDINKRLAKQAEEMFGLELNAAEKRMHDLEKGMIRTRSQCTELQESIGHVKDELAAGKVYFDADKAFLENMVAERKIELETSTDAKNHAEQLQATSGDDRKVYTSVEEFMADRQMLIDLVAERRQDIQAKEEENTQLQHTVQHLEKTLESLQKMQRQSERRRSQV